MAAAATEGWTWDVDTATQKIAVITQKTALIWLWDVVVKPTLDKSNLRLENVFAKSQAAL